MMKFTALAIQTFILLKATDAVIAIDRQVFTKRVFRQMECCCSAIDKFTHLRSLLLYLCYRHVVNHAL